MQVQLNLINVTEIVAIVGSSLLGFLVLAGHWRDQRGRLFGLLCLLLAVWKGFDFAHPLLTQKVWVDSLSWAIGSLSIYLAVHFFVSYAFEEKGRHDIIYRGAFLASLIFAVAALTNVLGRSDPWKEAFAAFLFISSGIIVGLTAWKFNRGKDRRLLLVLLGAIFITLGVCLQLVGIIWDLWEIRSQAYGMLLFEACFGYEILVAGLLRERQKHMRALEELGLREKRLEMAESRFRKMLDNSYDVIFTMDREGNILAINTEAREVLGFPVERMLGKGYLDFLDEEERTKAFDALARGLQGEKIRFFDVTLQRPDGKPVILSLTGTRLYSEKEAALVIARDVTGSREMEEELRERNRLLEEANRRLRELDQLKTELVGIVGHELRSPLTVINSYAAALRDHWEKMGEERKLACIEHVLRECDRLNRMVENVLDMSRIESEQVFLDRRRGDLVIFLDEVTREMAMSPRSRPMHLVTSVRSIELEADWDKIKQVLINLLDNAFRYSPPEGRVVITSDVQDAKAVVRVKDQGTGIPREDRDLLFEKFTQTKVEGMERGLGLGLYVVRTFVEAHGGQVWIEDEAGMGAVLAFSLPLQEQ